MTKRRPPPPPRVIAVDVDQTLKINGAANQRLIEWLRRRKSDGMFLILWSSAGELHARRVAEAFGCSEIFDVIISKPGFIIDDQGWGWTQYAPAVKPEDIDFDL